MGKLKVNKWSVVDAKGVKVKMTLWRIYVGRLLVDSGALLEGTWERELSLEC